MMDVKKVESSLQFALTRINDESPFVLHKVTSTFTPSAPFSSMQFDLAIHTDGMRKVALSFNTLFNVEVKPPFSETLKFITTSRRHLWPVFNTDPKLKPSEKEILLHISSKILVPLCEDVLLEKRYPSALSSYLLGCH